MSFSRELKSKSAKVWEDGYNHPFVQELGAGKLAKEKFKFYLLQDYLYLLQYAKVFALATLKSDTEKLMINFTKIQYFTLTGEMNVHREYMQKFGITKEEIFSVEPALYSKTYTSNMLSHGLTGGLAEIIATVFPCALTYYDYAKRLKEQYVDKLEANFYKSWIENYASDKFASCFKFFYDTLDNLVSHMSCSQRKNIEKIFISSVEFEYLFWDMAYKQQMSY